MLPKTSYKIRYLSFAFGILTLADAAFAGLSFRNRLSGQAIVFSDSQLKELDVFLQNTAEPSAEEFKNNLQKLSPATVGLLMQLANSDFDLVENPEMRELQARLKASGEAILKFRDFFITAAAKSIFKEMLSRPRDRAVLLARDMEEIYRKLIQLATTERSTVEASTEQANSVLQRVRLVPASRDLFKQAATPAEVLAILGVTAAQLSEESKLVIFDHGYEGTIPKKIHAMLEGTSLEQHLQWRFIWRGPSAPAFIQNFSPEFYQAIKEKYGTMGEDIVGSGGAGSFRVIAVEHQPKWDSRALGFHGHTTYIMLDLDDTVLKEVSLEKYRNHSDVQILEYTPATDVAQKYAERLKSPVQDSQKVIHYEFKGETLRSSVAVRPGIEYFLTALKPQMELGRIKVLVTSANDPARTQAVFNQLKIGDHTLGAWGAELIERDLFIDPKTPGVKSTERLRSSLNIGSESAVVVVDDLAHKVQGARPGKDILWSIESFHSSVVTGVLDAPQKRQDYLQKDFPQLQAGAELILGTTTQKAPVDTAARVRSLAQRLRIYNVRPVEKIAAPSVSIPTAAMPCQTAFAGSY